MRSVTDIFGFLKGRHAFLYEEVKKSKQRGDLDANARDSITMMALRDAGRFILEMDPEDDTNPFGGPDDY
jgi:hypothetical protein